MGSLDSARTRQIETQGVAGTVVDDTPVALRLKYTGTGTVTTVALTTTTDIVLTTSDGGAETFAFATYTTMGALRDAIDASAYWSCEILDSLRADLTASSPFVNNATISISADGYYDALIDTSVYKAITYRAKVDRGVGSTRPSGAHRVKLQEILYYANVSAASANGVRVYEWNAAKKTETQIYRRASVDATETAITFASGQGTITSGWGNDLIIRVLDGTSLTDSASNFLTAVYQVE